MAEVTPGPDILQRPLLTQITAVNTVIQEELTYNRAQKIGLLKRVQKIEMAHLFPALQKHPLTNSPGVFPSCWFTDLFTQTPPALSSSCETWVNTALTWCWQQPGSGQEVGLNCSQVP